MQGKLLDKHFIASMGFENIKGLRQVYEWVQQHTELCHLYSREESPENKALLKEKLECSLLKGKNLFNGILPEISESRKKPSIPLSGGNRFSSPMPVNEGISLNQHEISMNKNISNPFKVEFGTACNIKKIPMPSRTYLRKK